MVVSTHGVITNARADHLDVMGPEAEDVALALAGSTPFGTKLFTAERKYLEVFEHSAADRGSELIAVSRAAVEEVSEADMEKFQYAEHAENVALALRVCADLDVDRDRALAGMQALAPEVGATQVQSIDFFGRSLIFVNAFAANDPESTAMIWERVLDNYGDGRSRVAVINCRFDRPQRSQQLAEMAAGWTQPDHYVLMGSGTMLFARAAVRHGLRASQMTVTEGMDHLETAEVVLEQASGDALIVGMCNVHGGGAELARHFGNRAKRSQPL
jgi:poly-gamma-glutamate synthase PgsB/CapB